MSLWGRFGRRARQIIDRFTDRITEPSQREPEPPQAEPDTDRESGSSRTPDDSFLPPGWIIAGLYHEGEKPKHIHATDDTHVTDGDIQAADAIIVQYLPAGSDGYKWIHGASGWRSIADQIERTIKVVSPAGTGA